MSVPIAETPEALTPQWLTDALRVNGRFGDVTVIDVATALVGTGQMCDSVRVDLTYQGGPGDAPASLIAKLPAADPTSRATALVLRSYEKEVRFYQQIADSLPMRTPEVYHADIDVETASFVLLLEDCSPARQGDQLEGCDAETARRAVAELPGLHAPYWGDPALTELDWLHGNADDNRMFLTAMLPMFWDGFRERYADVLAPEVHEAGDPLIANVAGYLDYEPAARTIVHVDYRLDNLLFAPDGALAAVLDWQTVTTGAGVADAAYFVGAGLLADDRRAVEEELVREYHAALAAAGVEGYRWRDCWDEYRRATYGGLVMAIAASMLVERTERGDEMFMAMASRHSQHALDLDAASLFT